MSGTSVYGAPSAAYDGGARCWGGRGCRRRSRARRGRCRSPASRPRGRGARCAPRARCRRRRRGRCRARPRSGARAARRLDPPPGAGAGAIDGAGGGAAGRGSGGTARGRGRRVPPAPRWARSLAVRRDRWLRRCSTASPGFADERHELRTGTVAPAWHDLLEQRATGPGHQLHHRLVGLDLGEHVAHCDRLAFALLPFDEAPLLHRGRERLHDDLGGHSIQSRYST